MQVTVVRRAYTDIPEAVILGTPSVKDVAQKMFPNAVQQTRETLKSGVQTYCIESSYFVIREADEDEQTFYVDAILATSSIDDLKAAQ